MSQCKRNVCVSKLDLPKRNRASDRLRAALNQPPTASRARAGCPGLSPNLTENN